MSLVASRTVMRRAIPFLIAVSIPLVLAASLLRPAAARAGGGDVIRDCEAHGGLTGTYSQSEYSAALKSLPADLKEYSNCQAIIASARASAASKKSKGGNTSSSSSGGGSNGGGSDGNNGSAAAAGASKKSKSGKKSKKAHATKSGAAATAAAGDTVSTAADPPPLAASTRASRASDTSDGGGIPTSLLVLLIVLGVGGLAALGVAARRRWKPGGPLEPAGAGVGRSGRVFPRRRG
jgi:hypothetical protein